MIYRHLYNPPPKKKKIIVINTFYLYNYFNYNNGNIILFKTPPVNSLQLRLCTYILINHSIKTISTISILIYYTNMDN